MPRTAVVAIVDDDQSVREALTSLVRALGYVAVTFECAEDLLKSRRRASVSCLITDLQMPGTTGPGVICYLTKPFSEDDLLACIGSILGRREVG